MQKNKYEESVILITHFSRTISFYNTVKTPLAPEDEVSVATLCVLSYSNPETDMKESDIEIRSIALKLLERINIDDAVHHSLLHKVIKYDETMNVILAIKCIQTFYSKKMITNEEYNKLLTLVVERTSNCFNEILNGDFKNLASCMNLLFFVFELAKFCNIFNKSIQNLLHEIEKCANYFMQLEIEGECKKNQVNYVLYKVLNFLYEMSIIYSNEKLIERILLYLTKNVNDESKELLISLYNKLALMQEKNLFNVKEYSFFTKSQHLDVKSNGIKNLLKIIKFKENNKIILEELQMITINSLDNFIHLSQKEIITESELKIIASFLENLIYINKFYSKEAISFSEKKNFRKSSFNLVLNITKFVVEKMKLISSEKDKKNKTERKQRNGLEECYSLFFNSVLKNIEDYIAFTYNQEIFSLEFPPLSLKEFFYDEFSLFDEFFKIGLEIFNFNFLNVFLERYFSIFLFTSFNTFSKLIKKYAEKIVNITFTNPKFFEIWNVFLSSIRPAYAFTSEIYSLIVKQALPINYERNLNARNASEEYFDLIYSRYITNINVERTEFHKKALKKILSKEKHNAPQLEKIFTSVPFYFNYEMNYEILNCIFKCIKPCYNDFTTLPKFIYEKISYLFDLLKALYNKMPEEELFLKIAINIPLSLNLVLQHFPKLSYFLAEGIRSKGELKAHCYNILEKSLDTINTEILLSISEDILEKITSTLLSDSKEGTFALAATQILAKYHSALKIFINYPFKSLDFIYPKGMINLNTKKENININCDFIILEAINKMGINSFRELNQNMYSITSQINTFKQHIPFNTNDTISKNLIISFLFYTFGWENFESEKIYNKAASNLKEIIANELGMKNILITEPSSHLARINNMNHTNILRHQQYVYDSLISLFRSEENEFLWCIFNVVIIYRMISHYKLFTRKIKVYFNYSVILQAFYESFSMFPISDYKMDDFYEFNISEDDCFNFFYKNNKYFFTDAFNPEDELTNYIKNHFTHKLLEDNIKITNETKISNKKILETGFIDEMLNSFTDFLFYMKSKKQKAGILGVASLLVIFKEEKEWIYKNFSFISASILFYMSQPNPYYKNLSFLIFQFLIYITKEYNIQIKDTIKKEEEIVFATDMISLRKIKTPAKGDIIEQLFYSLTSKHKELRIIALQVLIYYSEIKNINITDLLNSYAEVYTNIPKGKYLTIDLQIRIGVFDFYLFLDRRTVALKNNNHLLQLTNVVMQPSLPLYYEYVLLLLRIRLYVLNELKAEELVTQNIDFIVKNITNPIFHDKKIIDLCKKIISYNENLSYLQKTCKTSFLSYFADKNTLIHCYSIIKCILQIFPPQFTEELILLSLQHLSDYYEEVSHYIFNILIYLDKIPDSFYIMILHYFSSMPCEVDDYFIKLINKHTLLLEYMIFNLKESFIFYLLKQSIDKCSNTSILIRNILLRTNITNGIMPEKVIHSFVLLSKMDYEFKKEELMYFFKYYNRNYFFYFNEFYFNIIKKQENLLLQVINELINEIKFISDLKSKKETKEILFLFENKIKKEELINELSNKNEYSFDELSYLALFNPNKQIYESLFFYDESPSRILEVFKNITLNNEINEAIMTVFESNISYRIHLMILMPLLIDNPSLITKKILPKVLEMIYRLFGTHSLQHKFTAGHLLLACSQSIKDKEVLNPLFTQFFNFCIKTNDKEYFNLFKKFDLKLVNDFDFKEVNYNQFSLCLDYLFTKEEERRKIRKNKKFKKDDMIFMKLFDNLMPHLTDSIFYTSFLPFLSSESIVNFINDAHNNPKMAYYSVIHAYKDKSMNYTIIINALETLINLFKDINNDLLFINFKELIENYPYFKDIRFLRILGMLTECIDDHFIYENAINILESNTNNTSEEVENNKVTNDSFKEITEILRKYFFTKNDSSEGFLNFLIYIFRNEKYKMFYEELKPSFVKGLECNYEYLRNEYHELLKCTLPIDKLERMKYLFGMEWNLFKNNFPYTFLRLILDEEMHFDLLSQYTRGNDNFYEGIYIQKKRHLSESQITNFDDLAALVKFKSISLTFKPENLSALILEFCFYNKEACLKLLIGYLNGLNIKKDLLKDDFMHFALNLNISKFNSQVVNDFLSIFNYLFLEVRIKHNCYFSNIGLLEEKEKYLIYKLTGELEYYFGSYNPLFTSTDSAIKDLLTGNFDKARIYIQKSLELINEENFNEKETLFLEEAWKYAMMHLCQFDALLELGIQTQNADLEGDIHFLTKETGNNFLEILIRKKDSFDKFVYEAVNCPFEQDTDSLLFLGQIELSQLPIFTPKFIFTLNLVQIVLEIKELQSLTKENLSEQKNLWSKREPLFNESILNWIFFFSWRNKLFNFINKEDNIIFLQDLATTMNKITSLSRKMDYLEMAEFFNQLVFTTPNIRSSDAFSKVIEEIEILIERNENELALRKAKTTNISYFSNEQRSVILYYIAKLERNNTNFNNATQINSNNSKTWEEWGKYLEENKADLENTFTAFLNAAIYANKDGHKYFVKLIKFFYKGNDAVYDIFKDNLCNIDPSSYIPYLKNLEDMIIAENNKYAVLCLKKISEVVPQTCFRILKIQTTQSINFFDSCIAEDNKLKDLFSILSNNVNEKKPNPILESICSSIPFDNPRTKIGLVMISSLCLSRIVITHEQLAHSCLEKIFYSCPNKYVLKNLNLKNTLERMITCIRLSSWNLESSENLYNDFVYGVPGEEDTLVLLLLKCYKWLKIIENILRTYISSYDLDLSTCKLIDNLLEYEIILFGKNELTNKVMIDHFLPYSTFYMTKQLMSRTLTIIGSDGKEYLYMTQKTCQYDNKNDRMFITLMDLLSKDLKNSVNCFNLKINYKSIINFTTVFDLVLYEEPFVFLGSIYEEKMQMDTRRMLIEYVKCVENVSGIKILGLGRFNDYVSEDERSFSNEDVKVTSDSNKEKCASDVNNDLFGNADITKEHRALAYKRMLKKMNDDILYKGFTDFYGTANNFFLFRKKFTANYAALSCLSRCFKFMQTPINSTGVNIFSGSIKLITYDLEHTDNDLYRLSPNMVKLLGKEGLQGTFVSISHYFGKFLLENELIKDYLEIFSGINYEDVKKRINEVTDGNVRKIIDKSMDPEELSQVDITWYPWL